MTGRPKGGGLEGAANPHGIRWFRQKGESRKAYEAFAVYRDLGAARSQAKVAERLGKSLELMKRWSAKHEWVDRAASFDANEEFELMSAEREERIKMRRNDAKIARMMMQKAVDALQLVEPKDLSPTQLRELIMDGAKLQRLALGESTENVERRVRTGVDNATIMQAIEKEPDLTERAIDLLDAMLDDDE
jgi:uncharacterized protein YnzC (UPF0291/DUF896 family)